MANIDSAPARTDELASRLRLAVARLSRRLRQQAAGPEEELSPSQLSALSTVERLGPLTLGELAAAEQVQPPTTTRVVDRLEERGLVARVIDAQDRRVARVSLTDAGRRHLQRTRTRKDLYLLRRLRELDPADQALLEQAVHVLERLLEEDR